MVRELVLDMGELRLFIGDVVSKTNQDGTQLLMKVVALTQEINATIVFKREDELYEYVPVDSIIQLFEDGIFVVMDIPVYHVEQAFRNRYNKETIRILNISPLRDQADEEFKYFIEKVTTTNGITYHLMSEPEITSHYLSEGVETIG